ncbi:MAG TPA: nickel pincer cofactor biosynthesis protein LarC [Candidatus Acidoferrales bacterium]|nr:nickel pincer cofactor biosynthesis protein LarC [Candidatus Acidoferrales bacterium]
MRVLYVDAFAGISGDMAVGALLALGLPLARLQQELAQLPLAGYTITAEPRQVHGIGAIKFDVRVAAHGHAHRAFRDIRTMLETSALQPEVIGRAVRIFTILAEAEGRVHGVASDDVEFHEVGAVDSIVDVVGTAIGVTWLGVESLYVSVLPLGSGIVQSQHGPLPVPGPATVELLRGFTTRPADGDSELVTPTGAAIVAALATPERAPDMRIAAVGYGAGQRTLTDRPNLLRLVLGERTVAPRPDEMVVVETNIDDYNPELYDYVMDRLFACGAHDVYLTPVHMKKNRPGIVLSVVCAEGDRERLAALLLSETSTIGVRYYGVRRLVLARSVREVSTAYGPVRIKVAVSPDGHENVAPEYEDCKRIAGERNVPIKLIYQAAVTAAVPSSGGNQ